MSMKDSSSNGANASTNGKRELREGASTCTSPVSPEPSQQVASAASKTNSRATSPGDEAPPITTVSSFESHGDEDVQPDVDRQVTSLGLVDELPPSESLVKGIEDLIQDQFPMMDETLRPEKADQAAAAESAGTPLTPGSDQRASAVVGQALTGDLTQTSIFYFIVENANFQRFFMFLTFYALFIPDLDLVVGTKQTAYLWSIITFAVMLLFFIEIFIQCKGKPRYIFSAYFWLDIVASASLLPDTWLFQELMFRNNAFVAGRSS
eukprot:gnl/MRDRNA2_/MRDRNA2_143167_c0_seq1.p1 gnl/MRDRNA2_/MRDRNA2_143167_c0~~gnl/MRDRNA2_/MRDRNA2_143167_c0_seq1.p1  ORF type:complete len:265 (-),score=44.08 gnl/MRDRNA2_/MRDRNA2_143167_c0_seq1:6-800(-)